MSGPLRDIRVLELGHAVAGPFAASLLGDFGAEVVKIERPGEGDSLRNMGPAVDGVSLWWSVTGRNKKSVTLDLKVEQGRKLALRLVEKSDVVVANFGPDVLERLGLGWKQLKATNPRIVFLNISGFGLTGPYRERRGFGKIAEAFSGATHLTGHPDQPGLHPSWPTGDLICGLTGAFGILLALRERDVSGEGQLIDLALYEPLFRMLEWQIPIFELLGQEVKRNGPRFPFSQAFLTDICEAADGRSIVVSAGTSAMLTRIEELVKGEGEEKAGSSDYGLADRLRQWVAKRSSDEALAELKRASLVAGVVNTPKTLANEPHIVARGNIVRASHDKIGDIPMPAPIPRLERTPGTVRWAGPSLGRHTDDVLAEWIGVSGDELASYREQGII